MKFLKGKSDLVDERLWIPIEEMDNEIKVLTNKLFDDVFDKINCNFKRNSNIAFFSLCTKTRPYYKSYKWKRLINDFKEKFKYPLDFIVSSNGGIIPKKYWESYPFLSYDAHGDKNTDELYKEKLEIRLLKFLSRHNYPYVIADFRPNQRNRVVFESVLYKLKKEGKIKDFFVSPSIETFEKMCKEKRVYNYKGYSSVSSMYPTFHPYSYVELMEKIKDFVNTCKEDDYHNLNKEGELF